MNNISISLFNTIYTYIQLLLLYVLEQHFSLNRGSRAWQGLEKYGRILAIKLGKVDVLNGVVYLKNPQRIGINKIAIPSAFWKMYYNEKQNFQRCFYFENKPEVKGRKIKDYEVECRELVNNG